MNRTRQFVLAVMTAALLTGCTQAPVQTDPAQGAGPAEPAVPAEQAPAADADRGGQAQTGQDGAVSREAALALLFVGVLILYSGIEKITMALRGEPLRQPGMIALVAALLSVALKEWCYRFTVSVGKNVQSQAVVANAWHHRSDAFSSIGTALGIGGAIFLGDKWTVLDPIAAVVVSIFIIKTAFTLMKQASDELLEKSLPEEVERKITEIAESEEGVSGIHNIRTRRIGNRISIEMHLRMPGELSLYEAHRRASDIERELRCHFGDGTYINLHIEPLKVNGRYVKPGKDD